MYCILLQFMCMYIFMRIKYCIPLYSSQPMYTISSMRGSQLHVPHHHHQVGSSSSIVGGSSVTLASSVGEEEEEEGWEEVDCAHGQLGTPQCLLHSMPSWRGVMTFWTSCKLYTISGQCSRNVCTYM